MASSKEGSHQVRVSWPTNLVAGRMRIPHGSVLIASSPPPPGAAAGAMLSAAERRWAGRPCILASTTQRHCGAPLPPLATAHAGGWGTPRLWVHTGVHTLHAVHPCRPCRQCRSLCQLHQASCGFALPLLRGSRAASCSSAAHSHGLGLIQQGLQPLQHRG